MNRRLIAQRVVILALFALMIAFSVAPYPSAGQEPILRFAAIGDPHYGWPMTDVFYAGDVVTAWMRDTKIPDIAFGLNLGDYISGDLTNDRQRLEGIYKDAMQDSFGSMYLPWFIAFGNHDVQERGSDYADPTSLTVPEATDSVTMQDRLNMALRETGAMQLCQAFKWNNILFLVIGWRDDSKGGLGDEVKAWLEHMTSANPDTTTVIVSHPGPGGDWWDSFTRRNPQVALFIYGHSHGYGTRKLNNMDVVNCGLANGYGGKPWMGYFEITPGGIKARYYDVVSKTWLEDPKGFETSRITGIDDSGLEWISVARFVTDGDSFVQYNRVLAEQYQIELVGSSLTREGQSSGSSTSEATAGFTAVVNGVTYEYSGTLRDGESATFTMDPRVANEWSTRVSIGGSGIGFVRFTYHRPILTTASMSIGVKAISPDAYTCIFEPVSKYCLGKVPVYPTASYPIEMESTEKVAIKNSGVAFLLRLTDIPGEYTVQTRPKQVREPVALHEVFQYGSLEVSSSSVSTNEQFYVSTTITNIGNFRGKTTVTLFIDGQVAESRSVRVNPAEEVDVVFAVTLYGSGKHQVTISDLDPKTVEVAAAPLF